MTNIHYTLKKSVFKSDLKENKELLRKVVPERLSPNRKGQVRALAHVMRSKMYFSASPEWALKVINNILKSILKSTVS